MTNNQLDRERLEKIKSWRETYGAGSNVMLPAEEAQELARMALAVIDSEPVAWVMLEDLADKDIVSTPAYPDINDAMEMTHGELEPLYRHAQHPVVPDDVLDALQKVARIRLDLNDFDGDRRGIADCLSDAEEALIEVVNRRAAMLQHQPQNAPQNIPENIPGGLVDAVNNLLNNDGSRGCYDAMECSAAREKIELWLAQRQRWEEQRKANLSAGNSPVIPEGYVMVPKEPTVNQWAAGVQAFDSGVEKVTRIYKAMLAAAPQEVK